MKKESKKLIVELLTEHKRHVLNYAWYEGRQGKEVVAEINRAITEVKGA